MPQGSCRVCLSSRQGLQPQPVAFSSFIIAGQVGWPAFLLALCCGYWVVSVAEDWVITCFSVSCSSFELSSVLLSPLFKEERWIQPGRQEHAAGRHCSVCCWEKVCYESWRLSIAIWVSVLWKACPSDWVPKSVLLLESLDCSSSSKVLCLGHCQ